MCSNSQLLHSKEGCGRFHTCCQSFVHPHILRRYQRVVQSHSLSAFGLLLPLQSAAFLQQSCCCVQPVECITGSVAHRPPWLTDFRALCCDLCCCCLGCIGISRTSSRGTYPRLVPPLTSVVSEPFVLCLLQRRAMDAVCCCCITSMRCTAVWCFQLQWRLRTYTHALQQRRQSWCQMPAMRAPCASCLSVCCLDVLRFEFC